MDIVMAVTPTATVMVEGHAKEVPEDVMLEALQFGRDSVQDALEMQIRLARAVGKTKMEVPAAVVHPEVDKSVRLLAEESLRAAVQIREKLTRYATIDTLKAEIVEKVVEQFPE